MKNKIILILTLLFCMGILPILATTFNNNLTTSKTETASNDTIIKTDNINNNQNNKNSNNNKDKILNAVLSQYKKGYTDETIKALTILFATNYMANPKKMDENDLVIDKSIFNEDPNIYKNIENIVNTNLKKTIYFNKKILYIPFSKTSNGSTQTNGEYTYLSAVASPWDCYNAEYDENIQCLGVSISGLDYLCKNKTSAENALKWYLPKCEIK